MYSIYKYFISLLIVGCAFSSLCGQQVEAEKNDTTKRIRYNGFRVDLDISPIFTSLLNSSEVFNYEGALQLNLNNKYYPVFEMGYSGASKITTSDINYQGNALFYRLGVDFNLLKQKETKKKLNNVFLFGGRLGFSHFNYDLTGITYTNDYWGTDEIIDKKNIPSAKLWFEIAAGIRVEIARNIFIGWTARNKNMLTKDKTGDIKPWHIPGYGINAEGGVWSFNYMIGYKF